MIIKSPLLTATRIPCLTFMFNWMVGNDYVDSITTFAVKLTKLSVQFVDFSQATQRRGCTGKKSRRRGQKVDKKKVAKMTTNKPVFLKLKLPLKLGVELTLNFNEL